MIPDVTVHVRCSDIMVVPDAVSIAYNMLNYCIGLLTLFSSSHMDSYLSIPIAC